MRVTVDLDRCEGHGECVLAAPQVFSLGDDDDMVTVLEPEPAEALRAAVTDAAGLCPMAAITLEG
jgi:ferredoxin